MLRTKVLLAAFAVAGLTVGAAQAANFYDGKTITFVVGLGTGNGADLSCRMMAEYMGKYIPGNPTIIVKNMPSTNAILGTNFVGKEAKKDGLTLACGPYAPEQQLFHEEQLQVDMTKFDIVGGDGESQVVYARSDIPPGLKTGTDIFKINPADLIYGGYSVSSIKDISARAFLAVLGMDHYKYVTGFNGDGSGRAAIQQKFLNIWSEAMTGYIQITAPTMEKSGEVIPLAQAGTLDANGKRIRDPRMPDLMTFGELYQAHYGKPPSGPAWEVLDLILNNVNVALQWLALPPGSPPEAVKELRAAIGPMNNDPGFIADSAKLRGPGKIEQSAALVTKSLDAFLAMPPNVVAYYQDLIKSGQGLQQKKN